jgi:hypothetical protein
MGRIVCCVLFALLVLPLSSPMARDVEEFHAYLLPDTSRVAVDSLVGVRFEVDETAHQFNGYKVTIHFDPNIVHFDSVEEGSLMTDACGNTFERLTMTDSTVTYTDILLCDNVSLDGPGVLSIFKFHTDTLGVCPVTIISDPDRTFYDAGLYIWEGHATYPRQVVFHDAVILVIDPTADVELPTGSSALQVWPNPFRSRLNIQADGVGGIQVHDVAGRLVRTLPAGGVWDGRDARGRAVAPGAYFVTVPCVGGTDRRRVVRLP